MISKGEIYLALCAVLLVGMWGFARHEKAEGRREERESQAVKLTHKIVDSVKVLDVKIKHDSVKQVVRLTEYQHTTETLSVLVHDTLKVFVEKAKADAVIEGCTDLLNSCNIRTTVLHQEIDALNLRIKLAPKPPGPLRKILTAGLWGSAGYGLCAVSRR